MKCANLKFVPYDASISPTDNLYNNPNDLDSQPEFPLRTELTYYKQVDQIIESPLSLEIEPESAGGDVVVERYPFPPATIMLTLWFMGIALWCVCFSNTSGKRARRKKAGGIKKN